MEKLLDKIVTVIFVIALLAILYFVGRFVMEKMGTKSTADNIEEVDDNNPFSDADDVDDTYDSEDEDYYGADDDDKEAVPEGYDDEIARIMEDVVSDSEKKVANAADVAVDAAKGVGGTAVDAAKALANEVVKKTPTNDVPKKASSGNTANSMDDDSRYMVVAGSFTSNANADQHAAKLEKEGFTPEIVNFNNSRMYTVIASRYDSEKEALAAVKKLRSKKIDCYVHRKRKK